MVIRSVAPLFGDTSVSVPSERSAGSELQIEPGVIAPRMSKCSSEASLPTSWIPELVKTVTWLLFPAMTRTSISCVSWSIYASRWSISTAVVASVLEVVPSC